MIEQKSAIEDFANKNNIEIVRFFEERVTAAKEGRPAFNEMMTLLSKGKIDGACFHKIDRSSRNYGDWNRINILADSGINFYSVSDGINLSDEASRLPADILAAMSTHYIRNLRREVNKGLRGRLKQGHFPFNSPIGYLDKGGGVVKEIDPVRAPLVVELFDLYSTGDHSVRGLAKLMNQRGLKNKRGGKISKNAVCSMLKNPFYIGNMKVSTNDEIYQGLHKAIIDKNVFDTVQNLINGKAKIRKVKRRFAYSRKLSCSSCDYSLIGECQKGHVYYRCHTSSCPMKTIREEVVNKCIYNYWRNICPTPNEIAELESNLYRLRTEYADLDTQKKESYRMDISKLKIRLDRLTDVLLDEAIDKETYSAKRNELLALQSSLENKIAEIDKGEGDIEGKFGKILEPLKCYNRQQKLSDDIVVANLTSETTLNILVEGQSLVIAPYSWYGIIAESRNPALCGHTPDRPRTVLSIANQGNNKSLYYKFNQIDTKNKLVNLKSKKLAKRIIH